MKKITDANVFSPLRLDEEGIARVICGPIMHEFDGHPLRKPVVWEDQTEADRQKLREIARAVIAYIQGKE